VSSALDPAFKPSNQLVVEIRNEPAAVRFKHEIIKAVVPPFGVCPLIFGEYDIVSGAALIRHERGPMLFERRDCFPSRNCVPVWGPPLCVRLFDSPQLKDRRPTHAHANDRWFGPMPEILGYCRRQDVSVFPEPTLRLEFADRYLALHLRAWINTKETV